MPGECYFGEVSVGERGTRESHWEGNDHEPNSPWYDKATNTRGARERIASPFEPPTTKEECRCHEQLGFDHPSKVDTDR